MGEPQVKKKHKGFMVKHKGTKGQTYYGSASAKGTPFFDFDVVDNLKKAAKNTKKFVQDLID